MILTLFGGPVSNVRSRVVRIFRKAGFTLLGMLIETRSFVSDVLLCVETHDRQSLAA